MIRDFFKHYSMYDDCRRPSSGSVTKRFKKPCPPCLGEALRRGSIVYNMIFMDRRFTLIFILTV